MNRSCYLVYFGCLCQTGVGRAPEIGAICWCSEPLFFSVRIRMKIITLLWTLMLFGVAHAAGSAVSEGG